MKRGHEAVVTQAYQAQEYAAQLNNVSVGHTIEATDPGVKYCYECATNHCSVKIHLKNYGKRGP